MSIYRLTCGTNSLADLLLAALGTSRDNVPRFRDCYLSSDKQAIVIYTRTGGGNRDYYDEKNEENEEGPWNSTLRELPGFISDEDDDFDSTYAYFHFQLPEAHKAAILEACADHPTLAPREKWAALFEALKAAPAVTPEA